MPRSIERRAAAGHHRRAVRPLRLAPGRLSGHEGDRRAAQPVRWPRGDVEVTPSSRYRGPRRSARAPRPPALTDFRSYESAAVELAPGPCVFLGLNGRGKTNLVEAVGYAPRSAVTGSPRTPRWSGPARPRAIVRAGVVRDERRALIEIEIIPGKANRARLNRDASARQRGPRGAADRVVRARGPGDREGRPVANGVASSTTCSSALVPRLAGVRSDYERVLQAAQRAAEDGRRDGALRPRRSAHAGFLGFAPGPVRRGAARGAVALVRRWLRTWRSLRAVSGAATPRGLDYKSSLGPEVDLAPDGS